MADAPAPAPSMATSTSTLTPPFALTEQGLLNPGTDHIAKETRYGLARERVEYYRYTLFPAYTGVIMAIVFLVVCFTWHPSYTVSTTLGLPAFAASTLLVAWFTQKAVRRMELVIFRWVAGVHGLVMLLYLFFLFLYGWVYGGAAAIHDRGSLILWVASIIGVFFIVIADWILFFGNVPRLIEEQTVLAARSVEREELLQRVGWYGSQGLRPWRTGRRGVWRW